MDKIKNEFKVTSIWGKTYDVSVRTSTYRNNGNLYVGLTCKVSEDGAEWHEPYADITVNIIKLEPGYAAIDTNNFPAAEQFITENGLAEFTGTYARSGFCSYPIYKFDTKKLEMLVKENEE